MAKLYFYYSSMNAGKSTTLLQSDFNYRERGMDTMLWTAAIDTRYGRGRIVSRIGLEAQAHLFEPGIDMFTAIAAQHHRTPLSCVLVDEAQFLSRDQVWQLAAVSDDLGIPVLCYGFVATCSKAARICWASRTYWMRSRRSANAGARRR